MRPGFRLTLRLGLAAISVVLLAAVCLLIALQTTFVHNKIRLAIVSALEKASGGRVELRSFQFDWHTLSAHLDGLTIPGAERPGEPPLLFVRSLSIGFRVDSLFRRAIRITSLDAGQPDVYLIFRPDGSSNLPASTRSSNGLQSALDLHVSRFAINRGSLTVNQRKHRFTIRGRSLRLLGRSDRGQSGYQFQLESGDTVLNPACCRAIGGAVSVQAVLRPDSLDVHHFAWRGGRSQIEAQGTVTHFESAAAQFRFSASLDGRDLQAELPLPDAELGTMNATGQGAFTIADGLRFNGALSATGFGLHSSALRFQDANARGDFSYRKDQLQLTEVRIDAPSGNFRGRVTLNRVEEITLDGRLSNVDAARLFNHRQKPSLPWNARLSGPVTLRTAIPATYRALTFQADLTAAPAGPRYEPLNGQLRLSKSLDRDLQFGDSALALPSARLSFAGSWASGIHFTFDSSKPAELPSVLAALNVSDKNPELRNALASAAKVQFAGVANGSYNHPVMQGSLQVDRFQLLGRAWDRLQARGVADAESLRIESGTLAANSTGISFDGSLALSHWSPSRTSALRLHAIFHGIPPELALSRLGAPHADRISGIASGELNAGGTLGDPSGSAHIQILNANIYGQQLARLDAALELAGNRLRIDKGEISGERNHTASFSGSFGPVNDWRNGRLSLQVNTTSYPLSGVNFARDRLPDLQGSIDAHAQISANLQSGGFRPTFASGSLSIHNATLRHVPVGEIDTRFTTAGSKLQVAVTSHLQSSELSGGASVSLVPGSPLEARLHFEETSLGALTSLLAPERSRQWQVEGSVSGDASVSGSLEHLRELGLKLSIEKLTVDSLVPSGRLSLADQRGFQLHNHGPISLDFSGGNLAIASCRLAGRDTELQLAGSVHYLQPQSMHLQASGSAGLQLLTLFSNNLEAHGETVLNASVSGSPDAPIVRGAVQVHNGDFAMRDVSFTALTQVNGTVLFDNGRATVDGLSGQIGGGRATLGGFLSFGAANTVTYHLSAQTENVRLRSPSNISVTANSNLRFTGTNTSSLLAGTATISRVVFNPTTDVGNLLASFSAPSPVPANAKSFLGGLHLDLAVQSAPALEVATALSRDVETDVDLRLRGTLDRPVLLGSINANEGNIRIFGARYTINRGEIQFLNPNRIDPVLDLDLGTQARGIQVDITITGTLSRLNFTYRSDPPLQPRDIIALLTVGRTPQEAANAQSTQIASDAAPLPSGANGILGQVVSQPPNRLSKLFGITNLKIDPLVQGITNTPQARLTLEQQVSRSITVTYVTNLSQTSEQVFRLEWSLSPQYSIVAVRDDNGEFGIDFQYKKRFK